MTNDLCDGHNPRRIAINGKTISVKDQATWGNVHGLAPHRETRSRRTINWQEAERVKSWDRFCVFVGMVLGASFFASLGRKSTKNVRWPLHHRAGGRQPCVSGWKRSLFFFFFKTNVATKKPITKLRVCVLYTLHEACKYCSWSETCLHFRVYVCTCAS